ncbi:MAG: Gfo/Idh/MocA family oxidoreductase [Fimbriimonadaceae bacterium]|jgi:predicted dehydrogenase|nr:Gfo/Idh/MocA family oxidoreductase [Fimbriimonadaceae bacterium]
MSQSLRFCVLGCGVIHENHCDAITKTDGATLSVVVDEVASKAQAVGEKYGVKHATSLDEVWDDFDAIAICLPSGLHAEYGIRAAAKGKHVLTEKPIDIKLKAAKALVSACESTGVKHACISQHRFAKDINRLREAVLSGELGKMIQGDAYIKWYRTQQYYDSGDWRGTWALDGGGCLMNQGVHYVDMIQWVMGGVESVQANVQTLAHDIEVEDMAQALVTYKSGAVGVILGSTSVFPGMAERLEVHGTYGSAIIEGDRFKLWQVDEAQAQAGLYGGSVNKQPTPSLHVVSHDEQSGSGSSDPSAIWGHQHQMQIEDFVRAVADDRDPVMTCRDAIEPLKVILAIYESSRLGGARIRLEDLPE